MKHEKTARRLRDAMAEKNIIAQDLAERAGVSKASISQYINGSHKPSNVSAGKMAEVLDVSPLWLMGFDAPKHGKPKTEPFEVAFANRRSSAELKEIIGALLEADPTTINIIKKILDVK